MVEFQYGIRKNASGHKGSIDYAGMYFVDHLCKEDVSEGEDYLSYPITIKFVYGDSKLRSVTETIILLDRKIFYESYNGLELAAGESYRSEGNWANKLRIHLDELLGKSKLPKDIKNEISATLREKKAESSI